MQSSVCLLRKLQTKTTITMHSVISRTLVLTAVPNPSSALRPAQQWCNHPNNSSSSSRSSLVANHSKSTVAYYAASSQTPPPRAQATQTSASPTQSKIQNVSSLNQSTKSTFSTCYDMHRQYSVVRETRVFKPLAKPCSIRSQSFWIFESRATIFLELSAS